MSGDKKDFLIHVIFKVNFEETIIFSPEVIDSLKDKLHERLDEYNKPKMLSVVFTMDKDEEHSIKRRIDAHEFSNKDKTLTIQITPASIYFDWKKYEGFDDFKEIIGDVFTELNLLTDDKNSKRIGLRYINQIILNDGNPFDWKEFINDNLITHLDFIDKKEILMKSLGIIDYNYDDCIMRFQYGMFNSEYPNPISKREFVIDYDCYSKGIETLNNTLPLLEKFHNNIKEVFKLTLGKELQYLIGE